MIIVSSNDKIEQMIHNNKLLFVYFSGSNCNVCKSLKPKVIELLNQFPSIQKIEVEVENSIELAAQYNIFSVPAVLLFIEGKESIREIRNISLLSLENKISRYYTMFYN